MIHWHCHDVFSRMPPAATAGAIAVVIDVLRASTTMIAALANGARGIVPVADVDDARRRAAEIGATALLGGERRGVRIAGFDVGNSPADYSADRVVGRTVVITTTNGTAALAACASAREVLVGGMVNRAAVAAAARRLATLRDAAVHLVCAGTDGLVSAEDVLAAGAILDAASTDPAAAHDELDAAATAARDGFHALVAGEAAGLQAALERAFVASPGGANLVALGMAADIARCARVDAYAVVPRLDRATDTLRRS